MVLTLAAFLALLDNEVMIQGVYKSEQEVFDALKSAILSGAPSDDFVSYLKDFQQDKLTTGIEYKPPSFHKLSLEVRVLILNKFRKDYGLRQIIKQSDEPYNRPIPYFFTTLATMFYVLHEIEITNNIERTFVKVDKIEPPREVSYAEIIMSNRLLEQFTTSPTDPIYNARVIMQGRSVAIEYRSATYVIADLQEDGAYYKFVKYLLSPDNYEIDLDIEHIRTNVKSTETLSELIRHCGFTKELKEAFFPRLEKTRIRFSATAAFSASQFDALKKQAQKNREKTASKS